MIAVDEKLPDIAVATMGADGPEVVQTGALFAGKTAALFGVPGAFTPTCSMAHLPGFRDRAKELRALGLDLIACISVNDPFVMKAWGEQQQVGDSVLLLADGSATFTTAIGLIFDGTALGVGLRSRRYSMLVKNGIVKILNIEEDGAFEVSSAEALIAALTAGAAP